MIIQYNKNEKDTIISYHRNKVGPNYWSVLYKGSCTACVTPDQVKQRFGSAKFTPYVKDLVSWCKELEAQYSNDQEISAGPVDPTGGFGPECHQEEDPTANTKMVV